MKSRPPWIAPRSRQGAGRRTGRGRGRQARLEAAKRGRDRDDAEKLMKLIDALEKTTTSRPSGAITTSPTRSWSSLPKILGFDPGLGTTGWGSSRPTATPQPYRQRPAQDGLG